MSYDNSGAGEPRLSSDNAGLRIEAGSGYTRTQTWAVAVLDDGTEIRMRNLGNRVEVRTWDPTESCNPPELVVARDERLHFLDARPCTCQRYPADHPHGHLPDHCSCCGVLSTRSGSTGTDGNQ